MEIVNGVLEGITMKDIVNNKVIIPESVTKIGDYAFNGFPGIYEVVIPSTVEEIGVKCFHNCYDLKKIILPPKLKEIKEGMFDGCTNLEEISIPDGVEIIGEVAFQKCNLKKIKLPSKLKKIEEYAFSTCTKLEEVTIPEGVTKIRVGDFCQCYKLKKVQLPSTLESLESAAFYLNSLEEVDIPEGIQVLSDYLFRGCNLKKVKIPESVHTIRTGVFSEQILEEIDLPSKLSYIDQGAFGSAESLKRINTVWGSYEIKRPLPNRKINVSKIYAYLYAKHLVKDNYGFLDMSENRYINDLLEDEHCRKKLDIFKNLFYKMRKSYDVPLVVALRVGDKKEFSLKIWNEVKDAFPNKYSETMQTALIRMIEIFGIFEKDEKQMKRIHDFLNLFSIENYTMDQEEYNSILSQDKERRNEIEKYFEKCKIKAYCISNENYYDDYKKEYEPYLPSDRISMEQYKRIKKLSGTYGKRLNDFVRDNYTLKEIDGYRVKKEFLEDKDIKSYLFNTDVFGKINYASIHRIFDGQPLEYNKDFYEFLIENIPFIIENETLESNIRTIAKKFPLIQKYYLKHSGTIIPSLAQVIDYINDEPLLYENGNEDFMREAKIAGVKEQDTFDFYQEIYNKNKTRQMSSLVKRSNVFEIDGYTIKAELLRRDDPLAIFVGENNYTNCCQVYGGMGQNCMAHATNSSDGGIFVTKLLKDGEWILLTESWDWQNNNLYCHDNIEGTEYLRKGPESLRRAVAEAFRLDGELIIEKSKTEIEAYIEERQKRIQKSLLGNRKEELDKLRNLEETQVVKLVTSGEGYDDLGVSEFFKQSFYANHEQFIHGQKFTLENFQPLNYNSSAPFFDSNHSAYSDAKEKQYIMAGSLENLVLSRKEKLEPIYRDERQVSLEDGGNIQEKVAEKIRKIEQSVYPSEMFSHQDNSLASYEGDNIYIGEDWYLIYEEKENNSIYISDLARTKPDLEDEQGNQMQEMMNIIYELVKKYNQVEADLKEDTSYILYLLNKRLGYIEQIGDDISYPFDDEDDTRVISPEEQNKILKNIKNIKSAKNPELRMHKVTFKKGKKLMKEEETSKKHP